MEHEYRQATYVSEIPKGLKRLTTYTNKKGETHTFMKRKYYFDLVNGKVYRHYPSDDIKTINEFDSRKQLCIMDDNIKRVYVYNGKTLQNALDNETEIS